MKGYTCDKCGTELWYRQICGMRVKEEIDGEYYYFAYCPTCDEYFKLKK